MAKVREKTAVKIRNYKEPGVNMTSYLPDDIYLPEFVPSRFSFLALGSKLLGILRQALKNVLGKKLTKEIGIRMVIDGLLLNFAIFIACGTSGFNILKALYLTTIALPIFSLFGFYTYGRKYRSRYKILIILTAVTISYLLFFGATRDSLHSRIISWFITLIFLTGARLISIIWKTPHLSSVLKFYSRTLAYFLFLRKDAPTWNRLQEIGNREQGTNESRLGDKPIENVLVIGGAGYIGSVLVRQLLKRGYNIRILDLLLYGDESVRDLLQDKRVELIRADFRHIDSLVYSIEDMDAVIHLGAIVGDPACTISKEISLETNLLSTRMIAETCKAFRVCQKLIFASSCSVYGVSNSECDENSFLNPVSLYARTKIGSEKILLSLGGNGLTPVILRFATVYGLSYRPRFDLVVNLLTAQAQAKRKITIIDGKQWRPFISTQDVARAIIYALEAPKSLVKGEIFNVGSTEENYQIETIGQIIKEYLPDTEIIYKESGSDKRNYFVSFEKIRKRLGFKPEKDIRMSIREIISALEAKRIPDYRDPRYNNFLALKTNCEDYISKVEWCSLLTEEE